MLSSLGWTKPFSIPKAARMQPLTSDSERRRSARPWGDARTSDNDSPRRVGPFIEELGDLSNDQRNKSETSPEIIEKPELGDANEAQFVALGES